MSLHTRIEREHNAMVTRAAGLNDCGMCGLPAPLTSWYCASCWPTVMRDREAIEQELGIQEDETWWDDYGY